jgi:hypothetical protein
VKIKTNKDFAKKWDEENQKKEENNKELFHIVELTFNEYDRLIHSDAYKNKSISSPDVTSPIYEDFKGIKRKFIFWRDALVKGKDHNHH